MLVNRYLVGTGQTLVVKCLKTSMLASETQSKCSNLPACLAVSHWLVSELAAGVRNKTVAVVEFGAFGKKSEAIMQC